MEDYFLGAKKSLNSETPSMTDDNAVVALSQLNALSDKTQPFAPSSGCAPSEDYYVFDLRDCPANYALFNNNTNTISWNYGSKTCIQVQQMFKSNFQSRNTPYQSACSAQYSSLQDYYYAVYNFDQSNREAFLSLKEALTVYQRHSAAYLAQVGSSYSSLSSVAPQATPFVSFFNTLLSRLNCNFLQAHIDDSLDLLCIGVGDNLYRSVSMMTISAFCLLISTILAYVFATRFDKFRVVKMNPKNNIYLRKSKRLSVSQSKYLEDDLEKESQFQP